MSERSESKDLMKGKSMSEEYKDANNTQDIDDLVNMIEGKMNGGVGRLLVQFTEREEKGTKKEWYHHGRCDVLSPWANGTVRNCDEIDERDIRS